MSYGEVKSLLPQRNPFILIDKIIEFEDGKRVVCIKNVSGNEPYFLGHFPDMEIMPGVLILESMAQASIILFKKCSGAFNNNEESSEKVFLLGAVNNARFKKPVLPGDQLVIEITVEKLISSAAIVQGVAKVDDKIVAKATLTFGVAEKSAIIV